MSVCVSRSCTRMTRVVCLVVITALVPVFALAGDTASAKQGPTLKASAGQMVARDVAAAPANPASARKDQQGSTSTSSTSFFKTRPGMIALAVMAAGTGYALYSAQHDRISSPGKK